jgi:hypothetical protein
LEKTGISLENSINPGRNLVNVVDFETIEMLKRSTLCTKKQDTFQCPAKNYL